MNTSEARFNVATAIDGVTPAPKSKLLQEDLAAFKSVLSGKGKPVDAHIRNRFDDIELEDYFGSALNSKDVVTAIKSKVTGNGHPDDPPAAQIQTRLQAYVNYIWEQSA